MSGHSKNRWSGDLVIAGVVVLVLVGVWSGCTTWQSAASGCKPGTGPGELFTTNTAITLPGQVCISLNLGTHFKKSRDELRTRESALEDADKALNEWRKNLGSAATATLPRGTNVPTAASLTELHKTYTTLLEKDRDEKQTKFTELATPLKYRLFIGGMPTSAIFSVPPAKDLAETDTNAGPWHKQTITLTQAEDATSSEAKSLRGVLGGGRSVGTSKVKIGIGPEAATAPTVETETVPLETARPLAVVAGVVGLLLLAFGLVGIDTESGLLRDSTPAPADGKRPYSLARVQTFVWAFITLGGFLFIALVSGQVSGVMNTDIVALVGLSGFNLAAAGAIDTNTPPPAAAAASDGSEGFLRDILSDNRGIALHRVQMALWTLVLAGMTIWSVLWNLSFPVFGEHMLVFAAVANSTYLGFKATEKK